MVAKNPKYLYFGPSSHLEVDFDERAIVANNTMTVEAWFCRHSSGSGEIVSLSGGNYSISLSGHALYCRYYDDVIRPGKMIHHVVEPGEWVHVAMTYNGHHGRCYINGEERDRYEYTEQLRVSGSEPLLIGKNVYGYVAEVRIWALAKHYSTGDRRRNHLFTGSEFGLVGYWRLDEETGDTAYDSSLGYNQRGTIHNGQWREVGSVHTLTEGPFPESSMYRRGNSSYGSGHKRFVPVQADLHTVGGDGLGSTTSVALRAGQTLTVKVDPLETWETVPGTRCDANGHVDVPVGEGYYPQYKDHSFVPGALVGTLDKGETFFPVGSFLRMQVPRAGELKLHMWDQSRASNTGMVTAVICARDFEPDNQLVEQARADSWDSFEVQAWEHSYGMRDASSGGLTTDIEVRPGDILRVVVDSDAEWKIGVESARCSANGLAFNQDKPEYLQLDGTDYTFVRGSLIGTLDNGETLFPVGTRLDMTVMRAGTLKLYSATNTAGGSNGSLTVYVRKEPFVPAAPAPEGPSEPAIPPQAPGPLIITGAQRETAPGKWPSTEYVEIENTSSAAVSLTGWCLISWAGEQMYTFGDGRSVAAGTKVKFYTGMPGQAGEGAIGLELGSKLFGDADELAMLFNPHAILASVAAAG